ncbi:MAG: hypothetical protein P8079_07270, partial [Gammaproteobacteria bacterium]
MIMIRTRTIYKALKVLGAGILAIVCTSLPAQAETSSTNVAYIQSQGVANGGAFPFDNLAQFSAFNFYLLTYASVSTANLGPGGVCGGAGCDTVLLNVASSFGACNVAGYLSDQAKLDLASF